MHKLYLKIVVAIWGVMAVSALIAIVIARANVESQRPGESHGPRRGDLVAAIVTVGSAETEGRGEAAFIEWFKESPVIGGRFEVSVAREDGTVVYASRTMEDLSNPWDSDLQFPSFTVERTEGKYTVSIVPGVKPRRGAGGPFGSVSPVRRTIAQATFQPNFIWLLVLIAVPMSVALSVLIARYLVSPLRVFERAGARLAEGDLQVRIAPELGRRGDEIAQFAATFDQMAERIERLVLAHRNLLRDVSHDLRSPLARVHAAASLARTVADPAVLPELDRIEDEVDGLDSMIERLLMFSRLDAQDAGLCLQEIDIHAFLREIVEELRFEASVDGREITLNEGDACHVSADTRLLRSSIENVVRNALRYAPPETPVDVSQSVLDEICTIEVRDDGPGVREEQLEQLFEPFYQTETAREPQHGGFGIGLAIARRAVELHGGAISAANAGSGGLRISISLPIAA